MILLLALALFDGLSFQGWQPAAGLPHNGSWRIEDGAIATGKPSSGRHDLLSTAVPADFDLSFEYKLAPGANTGLKYFVRHSLFYEAGLPDFARGAAAIGPELQLVDDESPEVPKPDQKTGALYGLLAPDKPAHAPAGQWNHARILCRSLICEHFINGQRLLRVDFTSPQMRDKALALASSPGATISAAGAVAVAHLKPGPAAIALQHHNGNAWFRNISVKAAATR
ncbi:MAG: DUF1080 domain-containing protein [Bryobacterales bacterium]|nr:DUF1080 domain-containing protein [Bryobacterales bacterium]